MEYDILSCSHIGGILPYAIFGAIGGVTECHVDNSDRGVDNFFTSFDKLSCFLFGYVRRISYIVRVVRAGEHLFR